MMLLLAPVLSTALLLTPYVHRSSVTTARASVKLALDMETLVAVAVYDASLDAQLTEIKAQLAGAASPVVSSATAETGSPSFAIRDAAKEQELAALKAELLATKPAAGKGRIKAAKVRPAPRSVGAVEKSQSAPREALRSEREGHLLRAELLTFFATTKAEKAAAKAAKEAAAATAFNEAAAAMTVATVDMMPYRYGA